MQVCATCHLFFVDLVLSFVKADLQLCESFLVVGDGSLDLRLLDVQPSNLFSDPVVLLLLERHLLLGLIVLFLDLRELYRHFIDLLFPVGISFLLMGQ